jgi:hypothetical protein
MAPKEYWDYLRRKGTCRRRGRMTSDYPVLRENDQRLETMRWPLPSNMSFYYIHLVAFCEDDSSPFRFETILCNILLLAPSNYYKAQHSLNILVNYVKKYHTSSSWRRQYSYSWSSWVLQDENRFSKLLLRLSPLRSLHSDVIEEIFFSGLIGNVQIHTVIPDLLKLAPSTTGACT